MNVNTGEVRLFKKGEEIPEGFVKLTPEEHELALDALDGDDSVMLPEDHPLRKRVQHRIGAAVQRKAKRKAAKASRKRNRK